MPDNTFGLVYACTPILDWERYAVNGKSPHRRAMRGVFVVGDCGLGSGKGAAAQSADGSSLFRGAAGCAGAGAGAVVCAGACLMLEELIGVFTANDVQMLSTQMKMASPQVTFSMKSVVLR